MRLYVPLCMWVCLRATDVRYEFLSSNTEKYEWALTQYINWTTVQPWPGLMHQVKTADQSVSPPGHSR